MILEEMPGLGEYRFAQRLLMGAAVFLQKQQAPVYLL